MIIQNQQFMWDDEYTKAARGGGGFKPRSRQGSRRQHSGKPSQRKSFRPQTTANNYGRNAPNSLKYAMGGRGGLFINGKSGKKSATALHMEQY